MDAPADSLADRLRTLYFDALTTEQVTARLIDEVAAWGAAQGWRVYRRAPSVVTLPPPLERQHSVLDVALARPGAPPVVVEVDHTDRGRTLAKLAAEAQAGRVPLWVRWGPGPFREPSPPVRMIAVEVERRGRSHRRSAPRAAPEHGRAAGGGEQLPIGQ